MDHALASELVAMAEDDLRLRAELARDVSLFEGYHPEMRAVHERNADRLAEIVAARGWPGAGVVGNEAAGAAWLIAQHAISRPGFMREVLEILRGEPDSGVTASQLAMMDDRIRVFEGRAQRYGTQFDWDASGAISPLPIEDAGRVDERRALVGLPPIADAALEHSRRAGFERRPTDLAARKAEADAFAREVGWR